MDYVYSLINNNQILKIQNIIIILNNNSLNQFNKININLFNNFLKNSNSNNKILILKKQQFELNYNLEQYF